MSIAEKLTQIAENVPKVYEAGYEKGKAEGGGDGGSYDEGFEAGKKAEHDAFWDIIQMNGKRNNYNTAFARWGAEYIRPKYKVIPTDVNGFGSVFYGASNLLKVEKQYFDFSQKTSGTNAQAGYYYTFSGCSHLEEIEDVGFQATAVDTTSVQTVYYQTFGYCYRLHTIAAIRSNEKTAFTNAFIQCKALCNVTFDGVIANDVDLQWSPLSKESIENVITHLSDTATGKTLTLSKAAVENAFKNSRMEIPIGLTTTQEGANVTATDNGDGTITLNGTIDTDTFFARGNPTDTFSAGAYTLSIPHNDYGTFYITLYDSDGKYMAGYDEWSNGEEITFTASKDFTMTAQLYVMGSEEFNDVVIAKPTIYQDWDSLAATKPNWTISLV